MGIFSMLSWGSMWSVFGFISLISMVWVVGPTLQIAGSKPLESLWVRVALTVVICMAFLGIYIYKWYKNKKLNEHVIEEIKANEVDEDPKKSSTNSELEEQFSSVDLLLQKHEKQSSNTFIERLFIDKEEYIYQKPWFLVVGAPGVGKTSAILNSGMTFPIGVEEDSASRLAGTRDCDWFLTDESLLLDTAGRFITQDDNASNTEDWNELLDLLKRCRTKQPINGLVLMISVEDILAGKEEVIANQIKQIRFRLQELQSSFKTAFPLYIIVNKIDLLPGFTQYFNLLDENDRKKALGIELDPLTETSAEKLNGLFEQLDDKVEKIRSNLFTSVVHNNQQHDLSDLAISFASEFAMFNKLLKGYLKRLLNLSKYDSDINLAGIYFTSATQEGPEKITPPSPNFYGLKDKYVDQVESALVARSNPYFLNQVFEKFLLNTAELAGIDRGWLKRRRKVYFLLMSVMGVTVALCSFLLVKGYVKNSEYLTAVSSQLEVLEDDLDDKTAANILDLINLSHRVHAIPSSNISKQLLQDSLIKNVGLFQYEDVNKAAYAKYQNLIDEEFIPSISITIENELRQSVIDRQHNSIYKNLKAYLMLHQTKHYDNAFISQWVVDNLKSDAKSSLTIDESSLKILKQMLSTQKIMPSTLVDSELVEKARRILANEDIATTVYKDLKQHVSAANKESMPKVSYVSMGGPATQSLFRRHSERTLNDPVSILYTKYGYEQLFKPFVGKRLNDFYHKDNWVLGDDVKKQPKDQVLADIYQTYANNYVDEWQAYLDDIVMADSDSLPQSIGMAKQLSEKNSSLAGIIKGISDNTNLMKDAVSGVDDADNGEAAEKDASGIGVDALTDDQTEQLTAVAAKLKKEKSLTIDDTTLQGYLQPISSSFSQFQTLTHESAESGSQLNEITSSVNELYVYAIALQRAIQNNDKLLPDDKPLINYQAQISRLPEPFQSMLDTLQYDITGTRLNHVEGRRQLQEERLQREADEKTALEEKDRIQAMLDSDQKAVNDAEQRRLFILQTAIEQDKSVQMTCKNTLLGKYPFKHTNKDVSINEFTQNFAQKAGYLQTLGGNISVVNENGMTPFIQLLNTRQLDTKQSNRQTVYKQAREINALYFSGADTPHLGITMRVMAMDKGIEELKIAYDGQKYEYFHGPQKNHLISWPAKKNAQFSIKATAPNMKPASIAVKGDWSLYRLLDKAVKVTKTKDGKGVLAVFMLGENKAQIEFKSVSGSNPFDLSIFKGFKC